MSCSSISPQHLTTDESSSEDGTAFISCRQTAHSGRPNPDQVFYNPQITVQKIDWYLNYWGIILEEYILLSAKLQNCNWQAFPIIIFPTRPQPANGLSNQAFRQTPLKPLPFHLVISL